MRNFKKFPVWIVCFIAAIGMAHIEVADLQASEPKGVFRIAFHYGFSQDWNDPSMALASIIRWPQLYLFHDALVKPMPDNRYSPCLAESWTISPDFKVYDFKLRKGVRFHNGDEMTAEDVVFTFQRYKGHGSPLIQSRIEKLEAPNPYLFRLTFKESFPRFFEYFLPAGGTIGWVVPKKYINKVGDNEFKRHPIGCGPYKYVDFKPGVLLVGEAFNGFWRKMPNVKRIEISFVHERATRFAMLSRGEIDYAMIMNEFFYEKVNSEPNLRRVNPKSGSLWYVYMASQWDPKSPWSDPRVRKAASLAIDKKQIADIHFPGGSVIGCQLVYPDDPQSKDYSPDPYDPDRAKKMLSEAGYPKGFHAGTYYPWGEHWDMGEQIATYWKTIGITVDTQLLERGVFIAKRDSGGMKGSVFVLPSAEANPEMRLDFLFGPRLYGNYPELVDLWSQFNKSIDTKARKDLLSRIMRIMHEKTMLIGLLQSNGPAGIGPKVKDDPNRIQKSFPFWYPVPMEDIELNP